MPRTNEEVKRLLDELATLTELDEKSPQAFRVRAYQNASRAVGTLAKDVADMSANELANVKGIGKSTAAKIREYVDSGTIGKLDALRDKHPPGKLELLRVPGLGPKSVALLESVLGITDLDGLRSALDEGSLKDLPGMGEKTEQNIRQALKRLGETSHIDRAPIAMAMPIAEQIVARLSEVEGVQRCTYAGSLRRFRETIGDIDILVTTEDPAAVMAAVADLPQVRSVMAQGDTKASVVTHDGIGVDVRVVPDESWGAALIYFTGSKAHNIELRQRAIERGWILNEYELAETETEEVIAQRTEEEVHAALGLEWIAPELREGSGEVEAAADGDLVDLVTVDDIRGDLHDHTDYSGDGRSSFTDMIAAAATRGLEYFAITDHAENLRINGISKAAMKEQRTKLRKVGEKLPDTQLLHGAELNIAPDGSLDYDPEFLLTFDWLVASVHSHFNLSAAEQTERLITAMRNPSVHVIGHLSGRRIGKRPGIEFDVDRVLEVAVATGTAIELNSNLDRLDASVEVARLGVEAGVTFVISTDAHSTDELDYVEYGVRQARRAGIPKATIANTWDRDRFIEWAGQKKLG